MHKCTKNSPNHQCFNTPRTAFPDTIFYTIYSYSIWAEMIQKTDVLQQC